MDEITKFLATVSQIQKVRSQIDDARAIPIRFENHAKGMHITDFEYGRAQGVTKDAIVRMRDLVLAEFREKGHEKRRETLAALAGELESLRAILPGLAAKAAIEFGAIARQCEKESHE